MRKESNMAVSFQAAVAGNPRFSRFRSLPVAQELGLKECMLLFLCFEERGIHSGTVIYRAGEESDNVMYLILDGSVSISDASRNIYMSLRAGDVFGLFSFLDQERLHSATVRAESGLTVLTINREYFDVITMEDPVLGSHLLRLMFRLLSRMALKLEVEYAALREFALGRRA